VNQNDPTIVYRFYDADDALLYVGISVNAWQRVRDHRGSAPWWSQAVKCTFQRFPDRAAAEVAELLAIRTENPKFNAVESTTGKRVYRPIASAFPEPKLYDPSRPCPKCGAEVNDVRYKQSVDRLHRNCGVCRFEWDELPLDQDPDGDTQTDDAELIEGTREEQEA